MVEAAARPRRVLTWDTVLTRSIRPCSVLSGHKRQPLSKRQLHRGVQQASPTSTKDSPSMKLPLPSTKIVVPPCGESKLKVKVRRAPHWVGGPSIRRFTSFIYRAFSIKLLPQLLLTSPSARTLSRFRKTCQVKNEQLDDFFFVVAVGAYQRQVLHLVSAPVNTDVYTFHVHCGLTAWAVHSSSSCKMQWPT